jgi:hypothetical protein
MDVSISIGGTFTACGRLFASSCSDDQRISPERLSSVASAAPAGAIQVRSSMIPVTGSPESVWYLRTTASVAGPKMPSDGPGVTKAGLEHALQHGHDRPKRSGLQRRRCLAIRMNAAPCDWASHAVHYQPVRLSRPAPFAVQSSR